MRGKSIAIRVAVLAVLAGVLAVFAPASASAAPCVGGLTTSWIASAPNNNFHDEANWDNGSPSAACDAKIEVATAPVIISGAANVEDLTVGPGQELKLQDSVFPTLHAVSIENKGTIQLGCVIGSTCNVAADPAAQMIVSGTELDAIDSSGTILIAGAGNDAERQIWGNVTNTGTLQVDNGMRWTANGPGKNTFTNKGLVSITATCKVGMGDDCMYASSSEGVFINDVGGKITNNGGKKFLLTEGSYTQGAGSTSIGTQAPVRLRGGTVTMTGDSSTAELGMDGLIIISGTVGAGQTIKDYGAELRVPALSTLFNRGTILAAANGTLLNGNITTEGTGLLDIAIGTASHIGGTLDATGGSMLIRSGATLFEGTMMNHGGQIVGGGTIIGSVNNVSGLLNPALGIGKMTITGDYTQGAGATLAIEAQGVVGAQHDNLQVGQSLNLDGVLRIVPELGYFSPAEGDVLDVIDYSGTRTGAFSSSVADPAFTAANPVNVGYDDSAPKSVLALVGPPTITTPKGPSLLGSPLYQKILESLEPNGSFRLTKKPVTFPGGKLGLEVDTSGSCRLTAVEKAVGSAQASSIAFKGKKKKKGLIKKVTVYAYGSGTHIVPLNLTAKAKKLLKKKKKGKKASASAPQVLKDPLVITCTPVVYPVAGFTDGTQITGIGKAPTGAPPAGQPSIPSGPPTVQPGGAPVTKKPIVPLPQLPAQPVEPAAKKFTASGDLDATVGASVSFFSNGKSVTGFDASFRVVCGFPFPESAPLETIHFDSIPATSILNGGSAVIQGSFDIAQQSGTSSPPTWITASVQGDNSNGYTVRVYERRAHCEGGTIFNARRSP